jgi:hypothetical protein
MSLQGQYNDYKFVMIKIHIIKSVSKKFFVTVLIPKELIVQFIIFKNSFSPTFVVIDKINAKIVTLEGTLLNNFQHAANGPFFPIFSIKDAKVPLFFLHSTFSLVQKGSGSLTNLPAAFLFG